MSISDEMTKLGYSPLWIEYGFINSEMIHLQYQNLISSELDTSSEHYRYSSFCNFLQNKIILTDEECKNYLHLAKIDSDSFMTGAALVDLLRKPSLTDKQFNFISEELSKFGTWTEKIISQEILKRKK